MERRSFFLFIKDIGKGADFNSEFEFSAINAVSLLALFRFIPGSGGGKGNKKLSHLYCIITNQRLILKQREDIFRGL